MESVKILIVEDEKVVAESVQMSLEGFGYQVLSTVDTAEEAIQRTKKGKPDLVLMDIGLPGRMDGIEAAKQIQSHYHTPVIYLTACADDEILERAKSSSPYGYIIKPFKDRELHAVIQMALYRRRIETKLRGSEEKHRILLEALPQRIFYKDCDSVYLGCNGHYAGDLGISPDQISGKTDYAFYPHALAEKYRADDKRVLSSGETESCEEKYCRHGQGIWVQMVRAPIKDQNGSLKGLLGIFWDISERKGTEDELRQYREQLELLVEARTTDLRRTNQRLAEAQRIAHLGNWGWIIETNELFWSDEIYRICGLAPDQFGVNYGAFLDLVHPEDRQFVEESAAQALKGEKPYSIDHRIIRPDGSERVVHEEAEVTFDEAGRPIRTVGTVHDITEHKQAEKRILWQNALLTGIKHVLEETLVCSSEEEVANKCLNVAEQLTGSKFGFIGEANEQGLFDTLALSDPGWDACKIPKSDSVAMIRNMEIRGIWGRVIKAEKSMIVNDPASHADSIGTPEYHPALTSFLGVPLKHKGKTMGMIALANKEHGYLPNDLEAIETLSASFVEALMRKRAEKENEKIQARLQQAQKMEAIGSLAGGIAHDFNNILQVILGYTELALQNSESSPELQGTLLEAINAGKRGKDLASQILTFGRQSKHEQKPIDIRIVLKEVLGFLRSSLPTTIEIREDIQVESANMLGDPTQIHQILLNLCTNAAQAMPEQGGLLEIGLTVEHLNAEAVRDDPDLKPGPYLRLTVADTGNGMDKAVMERIFDPFFTTKGPGEGTGLGLSVVHGIVKKHAGAISVSSEPGKGTKFSVLLPWLESQVALDFETVKPLLTGKGRILFVDDEFQIVNLARQTLERLGYEVTVRTSSVEALEAFRAQPDRFDLVITDMTMPNMTGVALTKELLRIRRELPIILCTGFSEEIDSQKASELGIRHLLMKPVLLNQLNDAIREVLDDKEEEEGSCVSSLSA